MRSKSYIDKGESMGYLKKEEFENIGQPEELHLSKTSHLILQWRKNKTTDDRYLSIGKKVQYATFDENGQAVSKDHMKKGTLVIPKQHVKAFGEKFLSFIGKELNTLNV